MTDMVHIAAVCMVIGNPPTHVRQRCAWCGAVLVDEAEAYADVPVEDVETVADVLYPKWEVNAYHQLAIVKVCDDGQRVLLGMWQPPHSPVPDDCCMLLDPAATA